MTDKTEEILLKEIEDIKNRIDSFAYYSLVNPYLLKKVEKGKGFQTTTDLRKMQELKKDLKVLEIKLEQHRQTKAECKEKFKGMIEERINHCEEMLKERPLSDYRVGKLIGLQELLQKADKEEKQNE